jgi:hypothetical protein
MRALLTVVLGCLLVLVGGPARAHSGSYDMKYVDGSNLILLTFNTHQPVSGLDVVHNLRLYDLEGAPIPYDEVRVAVRTRGNTERLSPGGSSLIKESTLPMLATNESRLTYAYPLSGSYTLAADFMSGGRRISRAVFAVEVAKGSAETSSGYGPLPLAGAFLLGVLTMLPFLRRRRHDGKQRPAQPNDAGSPTATPPEPAALDRAAH